jgi:hypothetical protein
MPPHKARASFALLVVPLTRCFKVVHLLVLSAVKADIPPTRRYIVLSAVKGRTFPPLVQMSLLHVNNVRLGYTPPHSDRHRQLIV